MKQEHLSDFKKDSLPLEPYLTGSSHINTGTGERIASVVGGAALLYFGFKKFRFTNILMALTGAALFKRGVTGHCEINEAIDRNTASQEGQPVIVKTVVTIGRSRSEVYEQWRRLEELPRFTSHISLVQRLDEAGTRHHWEMEVPKLGRKIAWDTEIVGEKPQERILYRTYNGSDVGQAGEIVFRDAPQNRGTEMHVTIKYYPPVGALGSSIASMFNTFIKGLVHDDMRKFKQLLETGQVVTTEGQTSGRAPVQHQKQHSDPLANRVAETRQHGHKQEEAPVRPVGR